MQPVSYDQGLGKLVYVAMTSRCCKDWARKETGEGVGRGEREGRGRGRGYEGTLAFGQTLTNDSHKLVFSVRREVDWVCRNALAGQPRQ